MYKINFFFSKTSGYDRIAIAATLAVVLTTYIRLYFGVDFTDESYYVARAYQYALGAKPWVDDISLIPFAILTVPFVKVYCWIVGDTDGIILFTRHLYFAFNCLIAGIVFSYIKTLVRWSTALSIASTCIVFIPFNIPNLSYNTMGTGFFTAGCFWGAWITLKPKKLSYLLFSGFCHSLAIFAYPTLIVPSLIYIILLISVSSVRKIRALFAYCLGGLPVAFLLISIILDAGISNILISREYAHSLGYSTSSTRFYIVVAELWNSYTYKLPLILILTTLYILYKKRKRIRLGALAPALILLPIIPIPILYTGYDLECGCRFSIGYLFYYSTLAPYLLLFVGNDKKIQEIFYIGWLPSFISGILIAYTSGNGYVSAGLGMLSSTIVTTLFLIKALKLAAKNNNLKIVIAYGETLATLLSVIILASSQYYLISVPNLTYRDADIYQLHTKIEFGPFRGLYTTQYKKKYLAEIYNDLNAMYQPGYRVVFYYNNFPAGYLLTPMRSATNISFLVEPDRYSTKRVREGINNYIRHQIESYSVIAVKMKTILLWDYFSYSLVGNSKDFISQTIEQSKGYQLILSKKNYLISKIEKNEFKDIPD